MKSIYILFLASVLGLVGCAGQMILPPALMSRDSGSRSAVTIYYEPAAGSHRFLAWTGTGPRRWDMAVFQDGEDPDRLSALRVLGLPNESVEIKAGTVYINGAAVMLPEALSGAVYTDLTVEVPENHYFLIPDTMGREDVARGETVHRNQILSRIISIED